MCFGFLYHMENPFNVLKRIRRAGFSVVAYYHELDEQCPSVVRKWGSELGFGEANTKAWIVATPRADAPAPTEGRVRVFEGDVAWRDTLP